MSEKAKEVPKEAHGIELLLQEAMSSHLRLPMLEVVYDRFVRVVSTSLRNYTSDNVDIEIKDIQSYHFGEYMESIQSSMIAVFKSVEWENFGMLVIDHTLIYSFVDILFGGRKTEPVEIDMSDRSYTSIERNVVRSITDIVLKDFSTAFDPVTSVSFQLDRLESNPKFATIARHGDVVIILKLKVSMEDRGGNISVMLPYATIEPIKKILAKSFIGERGTKDPVWFSKIEENLLLSNVTIRAVIDGKALNMKDVVDMKVGKTMVLDVFANDPVTLQLNNRDIAKGNIGKVGDKIAIMLDDSISVMEE